MVARTLQSIDSAPVTGEVAGPPSVGDKEDKAPKEDNDEKEPKKALKKEHCKKAKKQSKKARTRRTQAVETSLPPPEDIFEGDPVDLGYCLQGELSPTECADLASISNDGSIRGSLKIEIVHTHKKDAETIAEEAEEILDSGDIALRFVGCKDMHAPVPPKKEKSPQKGAPTKDSNAGGGRRRRKLEETYEVDYKDETDKIDVTGVDFNNFKVKKDGT
jgi:hypothetical protein